MSLIWAYWNFNSNTTIPGSTAMTLMPTGPAQQRPIPPAWVAGQICILSASCCARQVGASGHRAQATGRGADGRQQSTLRKPMCMDAGQVPETWCRPDMQVGVLPALRPQCLAAVASRLPSVTCPCPRLGTHQSVS